LHTWRDLEFLHESDGVAKGPLTVRKRVYGSLARSLFQRGTKVYPRDATTGDCNATETMFCKRKIVSFESGFSRVRVISTAMYE